MEKAEKKYEIDMCNGPLFGKILLFSLPLICSGILQLLFNAADMVVVGRFAGKESLAAVGATGSLINLIINLFVGLSVGVNVLVARYYGAGKDKDVNETVHTAISLSLVTGVILLMVGILFCREFLLWMGTPEDVLNLAILYMRIYFAGMPVVMLYNFGSAILRAVGDTRRPLYYLGLAGILNVVLNLIFVLVFHMDVVGVALATVLSQCLSTGLIVLSLVKASGNIHLDLKKLGIESGKLKQILRTGLPAGFQGCVFALSNVLIQSSVNSFGSVAMAGNTAASSLEGFIYNAMNSYHQTALSFTSQNYGGGKYKRINKILLYCIFLVCAVGLIMGLLFYGFGRELLTFYSSDSEVIQYGMNRMAIICTTYFLCGVMDVMVGQLRGLGYSVMPMIVSLVGACGLRIVWILTVFQQYHSLRVLYLSYPVTWTVTAAVHVVCYVCAYRKQNVYRNFGRY